MMQSGERDLRQMSDAVEAHLGFIQSAISRMAQNSFQAKAWCIATVSALVTVAMHNNRGSIYWVGVVAAALFCFLDSYYLYLERGYRALYNVAAGLVDGGAVRPFDMSIPETSRGFARYVRALCAVSTGLSYIFVISGLIIMYLIFR